MRIRFHPGAERDLGSAGDWYDQQRPGLGADLAEELEHAVEAIVERPSTWPLWPGVAAELEVRRFLLARFPFAVAYVAQPEEIIGWDMVSPRPRARAGHHLTVAPSAARPAQRRDRW